MTLAVGAAQTDYSESTNRPGEELRQRSVGSVVGFDHQLSESLTLKLFAGPRYTNSDFRGSEREDKESTGLIADIELAYRSERTIVFIRGNQGFVPSTLGENVNRARVDLGLIYAFTEEFDCSMYSGYRYSESDDAGTPSRNQAFTLRPRMDYRLLPNLDLRLEYRYSWTENKISDERETRNRISLELRWLIHRTEWRIRRPRDLIKWPFR